MAMEMRMLEVNQIDLAVDDNEESKPLNPVNPPRKASPERTRLIATILMLAVAILVSLAVVASRHHNREVVPPDPEAVPSDPEAELRYHDCLTPADTFPSIEVPFVFFHQRKTGGSTMTEQLFRVANCSHPPADTYIACKGVNCETYYTPQISTYRPIPTIYGGQFYYPSLSKTLYLLHSPVSAGRPLAAMVQPHLVDYHFTCFTQFREPIARIQSCWNYRMVQRSGAIATKVEEFSALSPQDMESYLTTAMSYYGEGCLNEPMRIFSDYGDDELIVNTLHQQPSAIADHATQQTIDRSNQCIVGILERCNDTKLALERHLPFLAPYFSCEEHENVGSVTKGNLSLDQLEVVQRLARHEQKTYDAALKRLDYLIS